MKLVIQLNLDSPDPVFLGTAIATVISNLSPDPDTAQQIGNQLQDQIEKALTTTEQTAAH